METKIKTSLPTKLVSLRKQKGLTQMELAEKLNVSRQAISRWEVGTAVPSTDNLKVLGDLYEVPVDYLLNDDIIEKPKSTYKPEDTPIDEGIGLNNGKGKQLIKFCIVAIVTIAALILVLFYRNDTRDPKIPMEGMQTESKETYVEGTFNFK